MPLSDSEQTLVRQRFAARTTGTMYGEATSQTMSLEDLMRGTR